MTNIFGTKDERIDKAQDHYENAINHFKLAKDWNQCAEIYTERAKLSKAMDN